MGGVAYNTTKEARRAGECETGEHRIRDEWKDAAKHVPT